MRTFQIEKSHKLIEMDYKYLIFEEDCKLTLVDNKCEIRTFKTNPDAIILKGHREVKYENTK
jgi:hypothetical protein